MSSSLFNLYKTDEKKVEDGVPITYPDNPDGTTPTFYLSRAGNTNKKFKKAMERALKAHKRRIDLGTFTTDENAEVYRKVFVKTVLRGWENVYNQDGKEMPFNAANANLLFDQLPELYDDLITQANDLSNFRAQELEVNAGN